MVGREQGCQVSTASEGEIDVREMERQRSHTETERDQWGGTDMRSSFRRNPWEIRQSRRELGR